jgi:hypothetical protein
MIRYLILFPAFIAAFACAQPQSDNSLRIKHVDDFKITGEGNTATWNSAEWISLRQTEGTSKHATRVKLLYSEKGIYALFSCDDNKITATKKQDFSDLWLEDVVEIFFWTDEGTPLYFEYELSPLNYELAILVPNFKGEFLGWTPWRYEGDRKTSHAVKIHLDKNQNVSGWTAEFFIPYILLRPLQNVPPEKGSHWRVNMYRIDYDGKTPSEWAWQPVKTNFHEYTSFGKITFE